MPIPRILIFCVLLTGGVWCQRAGNRRGESGRGRSTVQCVPGKTQFPNPDDRHSFYKCDAGGNPVLFQCPAGTWFNPRLEVCDWDTQGGSGGGSGTTARPASTPRPAGTTARPPQGTSPRPTEGDRPTSQSPWATTTRGTRPPWATTARPPAGSNTARPPSGSNTSRPPVSVTPTSANWWSGPAEGESGGEGGNGGNGGADRPVMGGSCDPRGPPLVGNPDDCSSFFNCRNGRLVLSACPDGQYFHQRQGRCTTSVPTSGCIVNDGGSNNQIWAK